MSELSRNKKTRTSDPFLDRKYNDLFNELYAPLCRFILKFGIPQGVAEDIVQDLFVYSWENWPRLSKIASIKSYLYTAVKNKAISHLQKPFIGKNRSELQDAKETLLIDDLPGPEELISGNELDKLIEKALADLPPKCRSIFTLKRFGELTNKEIASELKLSVKTVEAQMTIAIRRMTAFISTHWELLIIFLPGRFHKFFH